jgi:hypothetical protein
MIYIITHCNGLISPTGSKATSAAATGSLYLRYENLSLGQTNTKTLLQIEVRATIRCLGGCGNFTPYQWDMLLGALALLGTLRHLAAKVGMSKGRGKQWQTTPKNLPKMQCARAIPVAWLGSGSWQNRPKGWILINQLLRTQTIQKKTTIYVTSTQGREHR